MLRNKWEFKFPVEQVRSACAAKLKYWMQVTEQAKYDSINAIKSDAMMNADQRAKSAFATASEYSVWLDLLTIELRRTKERQFAMDKEDWDFFFGVEGDHDSIKDN